MARIHFRSLFWLLIPLLLLALLALPALAAGGASGVSLQYLAAEGSKAPGVSKLQDVEGAYYLFLPASADLRSARLECSGENALLRYEGKELALRSGEAADLTALGLREEDARWELELQCGGTRLSFTLMRGAGNAALFLSSPDEAHGRAWVEESKSNKAKKGGLLMLDPDGSAVYDGKLKNLKGRGNSTWMMPKRPYQIKLAAETDLMETGDPLEAEETWVLLADYSDPSHLHNTLSFALASQLGLDYTPHTRQVDLWYDGEYRGLYLLSEKAEVSDGRVAVPDLEAAIEKANPDADFDAPVTVQGKNAYGNFIQYVDGLQMPESGAGGYLLELDYADRAAAEVSWFQTGSGANVVVKSPECLPEEGMRYISERFQRFEDAFLSGDGAALAELADLDSLARCHLIGELAYDRDYYFSSTYFYVSSEDGKIWAGPVWDFDNSYTAQVEGFWAGASWMGSALGKIPEFRASVMEAFSELTGLVNDVLLSKDPAAQRGALRSLRGWTETLEDSWEMDRVLWPDVPGYELWYEKEDKHSLSEETGKLGEFVQQRMAWLASAYALWGENPPDTAYYMDVRPEHSYYEDVMYVTERNLFKGDSPITFSPLLGMTRAMVVTVLHRMAGAPEATTPARFWDVAPGDWYTGAVAWAVEEGIVQGYDDNSFRPTAYITRQEFITMLHRSVGLPAAASDEEPDLSGVAPWAEDAMRWALSHDVYTKDAADGLRPEARTLRHEAATILASFCRNVLEQN